jgi:ring-1,2-phenylacetyl-CoA epoxidase subunit PaaE
VIQEPLFIGIKRIPNGNFSRLLFDYAKPGDILVTPGAAGVFTLPDDISNYRQLFFFAAGSGIIPMFSLIKTLLYSRPSTKLVLIYSNKSVVLATFYQELNRLQAQFPDNLHIEFLFSNTEDLFRARLHADLVSVFLETLAINSLDSCLYYICGPEAYMRFCTFILQGYHIPAENIKKEIFHTARPAARIEPPDKSAYRVAITKGNTEYDLEVQYPTTILQAARKHGIDISYSCEVGRCGNCMATCTRGKVWMSYNEVLTERELAKGLILTCTGYPVGGDVSIRVE